MPLSWAVPKVNPTGLQANPNGLCNGSAKRWLAARGGAGNDDGTMTPHDASPPDALPANASSHARIDRALARIEEAARIAAADAARHHALRTQAAAALGELDAVLARLGTS